MSCLRKIMGLIMITLVLVSPTCSAAAADDDDDDPPYHDCPDTGFSYSSGSTFEENLNNTLFTQLLATPFRTFSNFTNGTGIDRLYALYYCRGDVDIDTCHQCIQDAIQEIVQKCRLKKQGIIWYDFCTLRYANHTIFSVDEESTPARHYNRTSSVSDPILEPHRHLFESTMTSLTSSVAYDGNRPLGFATNEANLSSSQKLRGLAQCNPFLTSNLCEQCLMAAFRQMDLWSNTIVFTPNCNIGFELYGSPPPTPLPPQSASGRYKVLLAVLLPVTIMLLMGGFWFWRRHRLSGKTGDEIKPPIMEETRMQLARFTYSQVKDMTNQLNRILGEGGYGIVYYGRLSDNHREVAVKVLSKNDAPKQFSNEINVLGRIYHKNLVSLIGYCDEGSGNLALVYEYMSGGDLKVLLSGEVVSWKRRLAIAFDTAQGLDYLHTGCSPPIVHRDVKPANILLNQHLHAKVADFGFSKIFPAEYVSKLSTRVIGTPGYVDPQYHSTGQVNEKSDVYSFGVVLLELITGKSAILEGNTNTNLVQWVTPLYERGDIESIFDSRLQLEVGENYNTVWRATELAMKCVKLEAKHRPSMTQIVVELRECLAWENADAGNSSLAVTSIEMMTAPVSTTSMSPQPR
ncbi:putative leucine-rich repeat receptor-like serine/threonine-protein kinase At2g04300 [Spinacia oleracea]|uniref:Leucine-rich repeat receptor-like serine/threonine-protein kinase At2g04300 n=1 Tax=Spinacia oleracea TaxID=3562 RepID=A0A9R0IZ50_SPIOL|nr:putative leucine-rich repeat receptor-like serine/threonine-protein kinase At2g04300 [Spinacia oleracea]